MARAHYDVECNARKAICPELLTFERQAHGNSVEKLFGLNRPSFEDARHTRTIPYWLYLFRIDVGSRTFVHS